jgi:hypothetical protein
VSAARHVAGFVLLASIIPTVFGFVGTMFPGGFGEGFFVGFVFESAIAALITVISLGLWLLDLMP